jgi:hypothetical protein
MQDQGGAESAAASNAKGAESVKPAAANEPTNNSLLTPLPPVDKPIPNLGRQVPAIGGNALALADKLKTQGNKSAAAAAAKMKDWAKKMWQPMRWVLVVVAVFTLLALASVWNMRRAKTFSKAEQSRIQSLLQYATKSAQEAERIEHNDPLQALLHADYALCYNNAAKHIVDAKTLEALLGANAAEFDAYLQELQHRQLSRIYAAAAPSSRPATPTTK